MVCQHCLLSREILIKNHIIRDTVSSVGLVGRKNILPGTNDGMNHVCYFRHALALDERRVKFLPEYAYGGSSKPHTLPHQNIEEVVPGRGSISDSITQNGDHAPKQIPHTLEVWFAGTHSDMSAHIYL